MFTGLSNDGIAGRLNNFQRNGALFEKKDITLHTTKYYTLIKIKIRQ
jgi:hypothetical protein